jgi:hypothetical protein
VVDTYGNFDTTTAIFDLNIALPKPPVDPV